jgi:aryl-alcohol dehydrogenase-like predicted oxidoreductase
LQSQHSPPAEVYDRPEVFDALDGLVKAGMIRHYGVSVEKVEEAQKAMRYPGVQTVQLVFNMFRPRPAEELFEEARRRGVGILARVPLASGLLSGKMTPETRFAADDHRAFNRTGERFDVGETFSGVDFERGLRAVEELRGLVPPGASMAQLALRWILMFDAVSCAIPGARSRAQARDNALAADLPPLTDAQMASVKAVYDAHIRADVHHLW